MSGTATVSLGSPATRAFADLEFANVKILIPDIDKMSIAKVSVENGVVLIRRGHNILHSKCTVAKTHMLCSRSLAFTPSAIDFGGNIHCDY